MPRVLVIANQTLGGAVLQRELARRIDDGDASFHVVVPLIDPDDETLTWSPDDPRLAAVRTEEIAEEIDEAMRRSQRRLDLVMEWIRELGGHATGEVGGPDPEEAAGHVLAQVDFDEVIVSTLPRGVSRWLSIDLPSRLARKVEIPVTVVEADT